MMGGTMRTPLTAIVFAVELTHDFNLLPALLVGSMAAFGVMVLLMRRSILTEKLARRGHHIICEYGMDPFEFVRVREVMDLDTPVIPMTMKTSELSERIAGGDTVLGRHQGTLIVNEQNQLIGIITRGDMLRALGQSSSAETTVIEAGSTNLVVTFPDEPLHNALAKMLHRGVGRLPVVERSDPSKIIGYLGRAAILSARNKIHEEESVRQRGFRSFNG